MKYKSLTKWAAVIVLITGAGIMNKEMIYEIAEGLGKVRPEGIAICMMFSAIYFLAEGGIISTLARKYQKGFSLGQGYACALYCSFYRPITFGSGAGLAQIHYLSTKGVPVAKGTGMCLIQYAIQRTAIAVYGLVCCVLLYVKYPELLGGYRYYILAGVFLAVLVIVVLVTMCTWKGFSDKVFRFAKKAAAKKGKILEKIRNGEEQTAILQEEAKELLQEKKKLFQVFVMNLGKLTCWYLIPGIILMPGATIDIWTSVMLTAVVFMLAGVMLAPSGMGSVEFAFFILYLGLVDSKAAVSALLVYRFVINIVPFLLGGICVGINRKTENEGGSGHES